MDKKLEVKVFKYKRSGKNLCKSFTFYIKLIDGMVLILHAHIGGNKRVKLERLFWLKLNNIRPLGPEEEILTPDFDDSFWISAKKFKENIIIE